MTLTAEEWLRAHALLALRLNHRMTSGTPGALLVYRGPREWRDSVEAEEPPPAGRLVDDAGTLLAELPFPPDRARYLAAHVRAMRAVARRLAGWDPPLPEYARECLGVSAEWVPEEAFEEAHALLDEALPRGSGSPAHRLHTWRTAHALPPDRADLLPPLVDRAVAEARRRTTAIVPLPEGEVVACELVSGVHFLAAGDHVGGSRSTIHLNRDLPFNLADLLYVVTHEGHPGHIAESLLKERLLVVEQGRLDQRVRFLLSPSFVVSEGLGLHAQEIAFPGDEAQAWLTEHVLTDPVVADVVTAGPGDAGNFALVHRARNALFGVWANAAFLAAEGRGDAEIADYLSRWALLSDEEAGAALGSLRAPGMALYVLGYFHGWRLLDDWLAGPDRNARVRRLLTEQLLPDDLR